MGKFNGTNDGNLCGRQNLVQLWWSIVTGAIIAVIAVAITAVIAVAITAVITIAIVITVAGMIAVPAAAVVITPVARPFTPFTVATVDDFEISAAATVDPDAVAVIAPGAVVDAIGFAALANDEDAVASVNGAEIAVHVIGGAVEESGGARLPIAGNAEIGAAATVDPNAALTITPGLTLNASGLAALANHTHAEASISRAPSAPHIIGGAINHVVFAKAAKLAIAGVLAIAVMVAVVTTLANNEGRGLSAHFELRAAAVIDPDSTIVEAPSAIQNALGLALLVDHLHSASGVNETNMAVHIVGGAGHSQT
jgi:hypothetical protein